MDVLIDPVLLEALHAAGMGEREIAIHTAGVLVHDARSVRLMGVAGPGEATFEDDVVMAPVRLAHGVHWCGGMVRLVHAHRMLPAAVLESMTGRRLREVIDHPVIDPGVRVTGFRHEDASRFEIGWQIRHEPTDVTIIETDAVPVALNLSRLDRLAAPFVRAWQDRALVEELATRAKALNLLMSYALMGCMVGYWAHKWGQTVPASIVIGIAATVAWVGVGLVAMSLGGKYVDDDDMPHLEYRRAARDAQEAQGMRG